MAWGEWRLSAKLAVKDLFLRIVLSVSFLLVAGMSLFFIWRVLPGSLQSGIIALHYNVYLGIDDVRRWMWLFLLPGAALLVWALSALLCVAFYRRDRLASRTVASLTLVSAILWAVGLFFLTIVNS